MQDSMRELMRLKFRSKICSLLIGLGILIIAMGIILGLGKEDPLAVGPHIAVFATGATFVLLGILLYQDEETFAQKYDMTHLLDIDDKESRYQAYIEHISEWINNDIEEINPTRTRGSDPAGPDWGKTDFKLGQKPERRDAIIGGEVFTGLEGDLTPGEKMVADANLKYAKMAQDRWANSEANDPDLIEYGVERLGDLVKTDYFEKNAEEGSFSKVANPERDIQ